MSRADYAHWNEDADQMWWLEEGRFAGQEEPEYDPDMFLPDDDDDDEVDEDDEPEHIPEDRYLDQSYEDRIVGEEW